MYKLFLTIMFVFMCLVSCNSNSNNDSIGILMIQYSEKINSKIHDFDMNKWQQNPAYKDLREFNNPIYWGSQDSHFETKPMFWGVMHYKNKKQYVVLDNQNQLWFDQDGEFDSIPFDLQLEISTKSSKTNLFNTYGPYALNSIFPLFLNDYTSYNNFSLVGKVGIQMVYPRIIQTDKEKDFCFVELIVN